MEVAKIYVIERTPEDVQNEINTLKANMNQRPNDVNQNIFDTIALQQFNRMLELMKEHPELNPENPSHDQALAIDSIERNDPVLQGIDKQMEAFARAHKNRSSTWGIPMAPIHHTVQV